MFDVQNQKLVQALARLNRNPDFQVFCEEYLHKTLHDEIQGCIDNPAPARHQGAAKALQDILRDVAAAEEAYERFYRRNVPLDQASSFG